MLGARLGSRHSVRASSLRTKARFPWLTAERQERQRVDEKSAMPTANIQHRKTLEEVYPPDAFASDAAFNGQVTNEIILGVRILSAPNAEGDFIFERSRQHVAEVATPRFLAPQRREEILTNTEESREEILTNTEENSLAIGAARPRLPAGYAEFLDDIVAAAQQFGFDPEKSPGRDEPRLQGLRQ